MHRSLNGSNRRLTALFSIEFGKEYVQGNKHSCDSVISAYLQYLKKRSPNPHQNSFVFSWCSRFSPMASGPNSPLTAIENSLPSLATNLVMSLVILSWPGQREMWRVEPWAYREERTRGSCVWKSMYVWTNTLCNVYTFKLSPLVLRRKYVKTTITFGPTAQVRNVFFLVLEHTDLV